MKRLVLGALVLWLAGCDSTIKDAEGLAASQLRDPSSAQFRNVEKVVQPDGRTGVCGEINGKNAYGGYAGFTRFVVHGTRVLIEPSEVIISDADNLSANTEFLRLHTEVCLKAKTAALEAEMARL